MLAEYTKNYFKTKKNKDWLMFTDKQDFFLDKYVKLSLKISAFVLL